MGVTDIEIATLLDCLGKINIDEHQYYSIIMV